MGRRLIHKLRMLLADATVHLIGISLGFLGEGTDGRSIGIVWSGRVHP